MNKCILVMTDSDLVGKLYEDDELTGQYANPVLVADDIDNASFVGWEVQLPEIPTVGDYISLSPVTGSLIKQWIEKVAKKDKALCYFLDMVRQEPQLSTYWCDSSGERAVDTKTITRILCGIFTEECSDKWNLTEGLIDGIMVVDTRIFVPGCDTVILGVKHSL